MLLEKPTSNALGSWGEYARATREHISVSDEQKLAALDGIHNILEHLTLQHALRTKRVERGLKEAPYDTEIQAGTVSIQVKRKQSGIVSDVRTANIAVVSPGIFVIDQASSAGAILHAGNFSLVTNNSPARPGEYLLIYCTGLGSLKTPVKSGDRSPSAPPAETVDHPTVSIAGLHATVTFSGLAPDFVGLYQVNIQIPIGVPAGNQPVEITINGVTSNTALVAVR